MPWQFWVAAGVAIGICSLVLSQSIGRPYDAVPDQDLLWLSEALRLYRGAETTYTDHPGALWTLVNLTNLHLLQGVGVIQYEIGQGISINEATTLLRVARTENCLLCALTMISLWPIARWIGLDRNRSMIGIILVSTSSGLLLSLVQIRHEIASIFFASTFLSLSNVSSELYKQQRPWQGLAFWIMAIGSIMLSMYCKIQIILALPIITAAFLAIHTKSIVNCPININSLKDLVRRNLFESIAAVLSLSGSLILVIRFTSEQGYPFDPRSIGFWLGVNISLMVASIIYISKKTEDQHFRNNKYNQVINTCILLGAPGLVQLMFAGVFFRGGWTAGWSGAVFRSPTEIFGDRGLYYSGGTEAVKKGLNLSSIYQSLDLRLEDTFSLPGWTSLVLMLVIYAAFLATALNLSNRSRHPEDVGKKPSAKKRYFDIFLALTAAGLTILANSARNQNFYAIYVAVPAVFVLLLLLNRRCSCLPFLQSATRLSALILISTAALRSASNLSDYRQYSSFDHHGTLCYGQQMDIEMRQTSIGRCANFKMEMKN
jgi:hypothetical protein